LINKPTINLYLENYSSTTVGFDPYDSTADELIDITPNPLTFIKKIDAIYTYDKSLITNESSTLGTVFSLSVYMRYDDVPPDILDTKNSIVVELNEIFYKVKSSQNAYGIIVTLELER